MNTSKVIVSDPEIQGGTPCFAGTRVPAQCFFDALEHDRSIEYFLQQYPSVKRQQVHDLLREMSTNVASEATAS